MAENMESGNYSPIIRSQLPWYRLGTDFRTALREKKMADAAVMFMLILYYTATTNTPPDIPKPLTTMDNFDARSKYLHEHIRVWDLSLVWRTEPWWIDLTTKNPYFFVHASKEDETKICYFESAERFLIGRSTRLKPGRFLSRFIPSIPTLKDWAVQQANYAQYQRGVLDFVEHDDAGNWQRVYKNGPHSCMVNSSAIRVYTHTRSVLRLAYWTQNGKIQARCIVREDTKKWIRCYPDPEGDAYGYALRAALSDQGYKPGNLEGVLLAIESFDDDKYEYTCPYIDFGTSDSMNADLKFIKGEHYLELSENYNWSAQNTSGYIRLIADKDNNDADDDDDDNNYQNCDECSSRYHEDDLIYSSRYELIYCHDCHDQLMVRAYTSNTDMNLREYVLKEDTIRVDGRYYYNHINVLSGHDIEYCESCSNPHNMADLYTVYEGFACADCCIELSTAFKGHEYALIENTKSCFGAVLHIDDEPTEEEEKEEDDTEIDPSESATIWLKSISHPEEELYETA